MNVKDRIIAFIEAKKIAVSTFESRARLSNGYVKNLKGSPSAIKLEDILTAYQDLNRVWLLTGEGEMLKNEKKVENNLEQHIGSNNGLNIASNGDVKDNHINMVTERFMTMLEAKDRQIEKQYEQMDRLINLLEKSVE